MRFCFGFHRKHLLGAQWLLKSITNIPQLRGPPPHSCSPQAQGNDSIQSFTIDQVWSRSGTVVLPLGQVLPEWISDDGEEEEVLEVLEVHVVSAALELHHASSKMCVPFQNLYHAPVSPEIGAVSR